MMLVSLFTIGYLDSLGFKIYLGELAAGVALYLGENSMSLKLDRVGKRGNSCGFLGVTGMPTVYVFMRSSPALLGLLLMRSAIDCSWLPLGETLSSLLMFLS